MDYLRTTEAGLGINFDRPLTSKRLKSLFQYKDQLAGIVLNEPVLETEEGLLERASVQLGWTTSKVNVVYLLEKQDHVAGLENRPLILNKDNYIPWLSRLLRFAKIKSNGKLLVKSILEGLYQYRMIKEPGDPDCIPHVLLFSHLQTDDELTTEEASSYSDYSHMSSRRHLCCSRQLKLMNDLDRNQLAPKNIACVTLVHQTKKLHEVDYNQLYDYLKQNLDDVNEVRVERLSRTHDPLAFTENTQTPYSYPLFHPDQSSNITYMQHLQPNNNYAQQPPFNMNYIQQPMKNSKDILDPTTAINMALVLMAKGMNMGQDRQMQMVEGIQMGQNAKNLIEYNAGQIARNQIGHNGNGNGNVVAPLGDNNGNRNNANKISNAPGYLSDATYFRSVTDVAYLQTPLLIAQKEEAGMQLQVEEFDLMVVAIDSKEIEEANANCILMANLQQASTLGTHAKKAPVYDSGGSTEDDSNVIHLDSSMGPSGGKLEQHPATIEKTCVFYESLYNNLVIEVEKVNTVNREIKECEYEIHH
ncbi:hypothetical protein Tco_0144642 [Tanacetum coccineum]